MTVKEDFIKLFNEVGTLKQGEHSSWWDSELSPGFFKLHTWSRATTVKNSLDKVADKHVEGFNTWMSGLVVKYYENYPT
jgi:hypothetical protein